MEHSGQRIWYTIEEAAAYFGLRKKTLYSLVAREILPEAAVLRLGRQIRIDVRAVEAQRKIKC